MKRLLAIVEGEGEVAAVPRLLTSALANVERHDWFVDQRRTMRVGALPAFRSKLDKYGAYLRLLNPDAVLILLDLDDGCPKAEAQDLASSIRGFALPFPVAVVLACREYEAWFLASLPSITKKQPVLSVEAEFDREPEDPRDCKGRLSAMMPPGTIYKPTLHQAPFTSALDFELATERSRSFRRLVHAVEQLTTARAGLVTP